VSDESTDLNAALLAAMLATLRDLQTPGDVACALRETLRNLESPKVQRILSLYEGLPDRNGELEGPVGETYRVDGDEITVENCPWQPVCRLVENLEDCVLCPVALLIAAANGVWFREVRRGNDRCRLTLRR